ncbi:hypothetical protein [Paenibacillus sabinae]|uniref:Uncharacterized protein n=1 Tax=Paenibacillus sabinae T27 TaxID=1268072 RepID=X4ZFB0_9BACL|nr:hypothetical protein [Paenibacillus sabinae]AHV96142.1 hypothetical protein PSAB_06030 [Paenibacillus sabinae T27]
MAVAEIDVLKQQQAEIQEQKRLVENRLVLVDQGQGAWDRESLKAEIQALDDENNAIGNKISEIEYTQKQQEKTAEIEAQHEVRVAESTKEIAYIFDNLDFGVPTKELFLNFTEEKAQASYEYVRSMLEAAVVEREKVSLLKIKELEEKNASLESENAKIQEKYDVSTQENGRLSLELSAAKLQITDAESKRDAAAAALEEVNKQLEQAKSWNDDLQKQIAVGASAAAKVVDVVDARQKYMEERRKEEETKPVIYDIQALDMKKSRFSAKLAETDETVEFGYLERGKYRVVTPEQAGTFRAEYLAKQQAAAEAEHVGADSNGSVAMEEQPVTVPAFQGDDSTTGGVDQTDAGTPVADKTVEERLQALELAVFGTKEEAA